MTREPPLDLLIIGGLTVDLLPDGSARAGGTVIHAARATATRGLRIGIVTAAGTEPEARAGLAELRRISQVVESRLDAHSVRFQHRETVDRRRLRLLRAGDALEVDPDLPRRLAARAVLFGPVLGEIPVGALGAWHGDVARGAILQGWLRSANEGTEVRPLPLATIGAGVVEALSRLDLLVASREDLAAEAEEAGDQLAALRRVFGARPHLFVTDGARGLWHDAPADPVRRHLAVPRLVEGTSTVGAGDVLAAFLTTSFRDAQPGSEQWIEEAMRVVAETLEARSG